MESYTLKTHVKKLPGFLIPKYIMIEEKSIVLKYLWVDITIVKSLRIPHFGMINQLPIKRRIFVA